MSYISFVLKLANYVRKFGPLILAIWAAVKKDVEIPEKFKEVAEFLREAMKNFRELIDAMLSSFYPPSPVGSYGGLDTKDLTPSQLKKLLEKEAKKVKSEPAKSKAEQQVDECFNTLDEHCTDPDCCPEDPDCCDDEDCDDPDHDHDCDDDEAK